MSAELEGWREAHYVPEITPDTTTAELLAMHAQMDNPPDLVMYLVMLAREAA